MTKTLRILIAGLCVIQINGINKLDAMEQLDFAGTNILNAPDKSKSQHIEKTPSSIEPKPSEVNTTQSGEGESESSSTKNWAHKIQSATVILSKNDSTEPKTNYTEINLPKSVIKFNQRLSNAKPVYSIYNVNKEKVHCGTKHQSRFNENQLYRSQIDAINAYLRDRWKYRWELRVKPEKDAWGTIYLSSLNLMMENYRLNNISYRFRDKANIKYLKPLLKKAGFIVFKNTEDDICMSSRKYICPTEGAKIPGLKKEIIDGILTCIYNTLQSQIRDIDGIFYKHYVDVMDDYEVQDLWPQITLIGNISIPKKTRESIRLALVASGFILFEFEKGYFYLSVPESIVVPETLPSLNKKQIASIKKYMRHKNKDALSNKGVYYEYALRLGVKNNVLIDIWKPFIFTEKSDIERLIPCLQNAGFTVFERGLEIWYSLQEFETKDVKPTSIYLKSRAHFDYPFFAQSSESKSQNSIQNGANDTKQNDEEDKKIEEQ